MVLQGYFWKRALGAKHVRNQGLRFLHVLDFVLEFLILSSYRVLRHARLELLHLPVDVTQVGSDDVRLLYSLANGQPVLHRFEGQVLNHRIISEWTEKLSENKKRYNALVSSSILQPPFVSCSVRPFPSAGFSLWFQPLLPALSSPGWRCADRL